MEPYQGEHCCSSLSGCPMSYAVLLLQEAPGEMLTQAKCTNTHLESPAAWPHQCIVRSIRLHMFAQGQQHGTHEWPEYAACKQWLWPACQSRVAGTKPAVPSQLVAVPEVAITAGAQADVSTCSMLLVLLLYLHLAKPNSDVQVCSAT